MKSILRSISNPSNLAREVSTRLLSAENKRSTGCHKHFHLEFPVCFTYDSKTYGVDKILFIAKQTPLCKFVSFFIQSYSLPSGNPRWTSLKSERLAVSLTLLGYSYSNEEIKINSNSRLVNYLDQGPADNFEEMVRRHDEK